MWMLFFISGWAVVTALSPAAVCTCSNVAVLVSCLTQLKAKHPVIPEEWLVVATIMSVRCVQKCGDVDAWLAERWAELDSEGGDGQT